MENKKSSAARASLSRLSFARKADDVIFSEDARKVIDPRSISLRAIKELRDQVLSREVAQGVELYVAKRDHSNKVQKGATIQAVETMSDGKMKGLVAYVDNPIIFEPGKDADPKPRQDWSTEDVAEYVVLALTSKFPKAQLYLNHLDEEDIGKDFQGTFVSQARKCRFQDLVAALEDHFGKDADTTFVWLDLFCANQPLLTSADKTLSRDVILARNQYLTHGLHRAIGRFESAVIFFDRWDMPAPLQRAWCVWEIMGAITQAQSFQVVFAPGQVQAFIKALLEDVDGLGKILALNNNNMRDAKCNKRDDKEMIDKAVEATVPGGYATLNRHVFSWRMQKVREIVSQARNGDALSLARLLFSTGVLWFKQGEYKEALQSFSETLSIFKEVLPDRHPYVASTLFGIANVYREQGRFEEALACYEEGLSIYKDVLGDRHPSVANTLNSIASVYDDQGRYKEALAYYEEALSIRKNVLGDRHPLVANTLNNIASEALANYEEALSIAKESLGDRHPDVATTLNNIALVYANQGRYEEALAYYEEALSIRKNVLGDRHPSVANTLNSIASVYDDQGRYEEALANYEEALSIRKNVLGDRHPFVANTLNNMRAINVEKRLHDQLQVDARRAVEGLPADFLSSLQLRCYALERGADVILRIFDRLVNARTREAMAIWKAFDEAAKAREQHHKILAFTQQRGLLLLQEMMRRVQLGALVRVMEKWKETALFARIIVAKVIFRQRILYAVEEKKQRAAATQVQCFVRGHFARRRVALLRQQRREFFAATIIQCAARSWIARLQAERRRAIIAAAAADASRLAFEAARREISAAMIQRLYRTYRRHAIFNTAAEAMMEMTLAAERDIAARTIQQFVREISIYRMMKQLQINVETNILESTIRIQAQVRAYWARQEFARRRKEYRERRIAAIRLQASRRGQVGRKAAVERRRSSINLVQKLEQARWTQLRQRLGRRVIKRFLDRRRFVLQLSFEGWKRALQVMREEREEQKLIQALRQMRMAHLARLFRSWCTFVEVQKQRRDLMRRAINHLRLRTYTRTFTQWVEVVHASHAHKQKLVKVFLACVDLNALNSRRQVELRNLAEAFAWNTMCTMAMRQIREVVYVRRLQMQRAAVHYEREWVKRTPGRRFARWTLFVELAKHRRDQHRRAERLRDEHAVKKARAAWRAYMVYKELRRAQNAKALAHRLVALQQWAIRSWREGVQVVKQDRANWAAAEALCDRHRSRRAFSGVHLGVMEILRMRAAFAKAIAHDQRKTLSVALQRLFEITHEELMRRRNAAALILQCAWRRRWARLERFQLWMAREYRRERELLRELEAKRLAFQTARELQVLESPDDLEKARDASHRAHIFVFTAPWVPARQHEHLTGVLALGNAKEAGLRCIVSLDQIGVEKALDFDARAFPCTTLVWFGHACGIDKPDEAWTKTTSRFIRMVLDPLRDALRVVPTAGLDWDARACIPFPGEKDMVGAVSAAQRKAQELGPVALAKAATCIQTLYRHTRTWILTKKWQTLVNDVVRAEEKAREALFWEKQSYVAYETHRDGQPARKFHFNHKLADSTWAEVLPIQRRALPLILVSSTGHVQELDGLVRGSSVTDLRRRIEKELNLSCDAQRVCLRPDGVWFDGSIIIPIYNRDPEAKIGAGASVEVLDLESNTWRPGVVIKVDASENVDVEFEGDVVAQSPIDASKSKRSSLQRSNTEKPAIVAASKQSPELYSFQRGKTETAMTEAAKVSIRREIPRSEVRLRELVDMDATHSLFDLGFRAGAVVEVSPKLEVSLQTKEKDEAEPKEDAVRAANPTSKEKSAKPSMAQEEDEFAILCEGGCDGSGELLCRECKKVFCDACFIRVHKSEDAVDELGEFDAYLHQRRHAKHHFVPIEMTKIADSIRDSMPNSGKNLAGLRLQKRMLRLEKTGRAPTFAQLRRMSKLAETQAELALKPRARRQGPQFCTECNVRLVQVNCSACSDSFCKLCFAHLHDKGARMKHSPSNLTGNGKPLAGMEWSMRELKDRKWQCKFTVAEAKSAAEEAERLRLAELAAAEYIIKEAFQRYDADGSGALDAEELKGFLRNEICEPVSDEEVQEAIRRMDTDQNGLIELSELLEWFVDLRKQEGRDSAKMRLLRMNLQAKKRSRMFKEQVDAMLPREKLESTRKYLEEQAKKWRERRPPVPGYSFCSQLQKSDFSAMLPLFERYVKREFKLDVNLQIRHGLSQPQEKIERMKVAFSSVFMPNYNRGVLPRIYYEDMREIAHEGVSYLQRWSEEKDYFEYVNCSTGEVLELNPVMVAEHEPGAQAAFERFDKDKSGGLSRAEVRLMIEQELCLKLSRAQLKAAMQQLDRNDDNSVSFDELLAWFVRGVDNGEYVFSRELRRKRKIRELGGRVPDLSRTVVGGISSKALLVGNSVAKGTSAQITSLRATLAVAGKSPLYRRLIESGWRPVDIEKAMDRCKGQKGNPDAFEAAVEAWLEKNAVRDNEE
ncbi:Kinesin light chain 3 [Hondaea fermentalgiana]|uniref:Kinesin light chain 3 n=1 Tax=Hondaea fermentalgiana TaxID=2315210 RepID=A0A2R5FZJ8_9STRA|nr:Kinesin light chain 3 [Hondaea fermentalgiana]|eukprot:GBG24160.1 Kinesin light chain 3 [Hondaea fermentalgiana]